MKKKELIENDIIQFKILISPTQEEIALELEKQLANMDGEYKKYASNITRLEEEWHRAVDEIVKIMKAEIMEIKVKHRHILQKHLDEIKQEQVLTKKYLLALVDIKEFNDVSLTTEYNSNIGI